VLPPGGLPPAPRHARSRRPRGPPRNAEELVQTVARETNQRSVAMADASQWALRMETARDRRASPLRRGGTFSRASVARGGDPWRVRRSQSAEGRRRSVGELLDDSNVHQWFSPSMANTPPPSALRVTATVASPVVTRRRHAKRGAISNSPLAASQAPPSSSTSSPMREQQAPAAAGRLALLENLMKTPDARAAILSGIHRLLRAGEFREPEEVQGSRPAPAVQEEAPSTHSQLSKELEAVSHSVKQQLASLELLLHGKPSTELVLAEKPFQPLDSLPPTTTAPTPPREAVRSAVDDDTDEPSVDVDAKVEADGTEAPETEEAVPVEEEKSSASEEPPPTIRHMLKEIADSEAPAGSNASANQTAQASSDAPAQRAVPPPPPGRGVGSASSYKAETTSKLLELATMIGPPPAHTALQPPSLPDIISLNDLVRMEQVRTVTDSVSAAERDRIVHSERQRDLDVGLVRAKSTAVTINGSLSVYRKVYGSVEGIEPSVARGRSRSTGVMGGWKASRAPPDAAISVRPPATNALPQVQASEPPPVASTPPKKQVQFEGRSGTVPSPLVTRAGAGLEAAGTRWLNSPALALRIDADGNLVLRERSRQSLVATQLTGNLGSQALASVLEQAASPAE
jgi:hypothetical protein